MRRYFMDTHLIRTLLIMCILEWQLAVNMRKCMTKSLMVVIRYLS